MLHARSDYDRIQDPALLDNRLLSEGSSAIGEDEPVFLLRARDALSPAIVMAWAEAYSKLGGLCDPNVYNAVVAWAGRMHDWQIEHGCKVPDTPRETLR